MGKDKVLSPQEIYRARKQREEEERTAFLPPGLTNHGNTCFMNSVLQGLIATRLLADLIFFRQLPPSAQYASYYYSPIASRRSPQLTNAHGVAGEYEKPWFSGMPLGDTLVQVVAKAWLLQERRSRDNLSPRELLWMMSRKHDQYLDFAQQDAHEFLVLLLDAIRVEELDVIKKRQPPQETSPTRPRLGRIASAPPGPSTFTPLDRGRSSPSETSAHPSTVQDSATESIQEVDEEERLVPLTDMLFGGKLTSILVCQKCKHVSQTYEDFTDLSLPLKAEDYVRERKRDMFKNFAKKLIPANMAGGTPVIARSSSVPPSPRWESGSGSREVEPAIEADTRRRSWDHAVESGRAAGDDSGPSSGTPREWEGSAEIPSLLDGEGWAHIDGEKHVKPDTLYVAGESKKESPKLKDKDEDAWTKLGRRISLTVGFGSKDKAKEKNNRLEREQERKQHSREVPNVDVVKDSTRSSLSDIGHSASVMEKAPSPATSLADLPILSPLPQSPPSPPSTATRFPNIQRPALSRSSTRSSQPLKLSTRETAYLRKLLADTVPANPFARFKPQVVGNGDTSQNLWLKLGQLPGIEECLRMFTAVENLEGENSVGCRRCWKIANGLYRPRTYEDPDRPLGTADSDSDKDRSVDSKDALADQLHRSAPPQIPLKSHSPSSSSASLDASDHVSVSSAPTTVASSKPSAPSLVINRDYNDPNCPPSTTPAGLPIPLISTTEPLSPVRESTPPIEANGSLRAPRWSSVTRRVAKEGDADALHDDSDEFDSDTSMETSGGLDRPSRSHPLTNRQDQQAPTSDRSGLRPPTLDSPRSPQVIMRPAYKRYLIASAPPILIVHLKRFQQINKTHAISFTQGFRKLDDYVAFPEYLDLGPYMAPRKEDFGLLRRRKTKSKSKSMQADPCKYRLYAVVVHIGNILGGHYVAYVALPHPPTSPPASEPAPASTASNDKVNADQLSNPIQRQWAYVSDTVVRLTTLDEVLKVKAYICMYERL